MQSRTAVCGNFFPLKTVVVAYFQQQQQQRRRRLQLCGFSACLDGWPSQLIRICWVLLFLHRSSCNVPIILSQLNEALISSTDIRKIIWNFVRLRPVGAELFHVDRQTRPGGRTDWLVGGKEGMRKLIVAFRSLRSCLRTELCTLVNNLLRNTEQSLFCNHIRIRMEIRHNSAL
jgi:hypothetical protein